MSLWIKWWSFQRKTSVAKVETALICMHKYKYLKLFKDLFLIMCLCVGACMWVWVWVGTEDRRGCYILWAIVSDGCELLTWVLGIFSHLWKQQKLLITKPSSQPSYYLEVSWQAFPLNKATLVCSPHRAYDLFSHKILPRSTGLAMSCFLWIRP